MGYAADDTPLSVENQEAKAQFVKALTGDIPDEFIEIAWQKRVEKDQVRRFQLSIAILFTMLNEGPALVRGDDDQRIASWKKCVASVENSWAASAALWLAGHYAQATALAIITLEETGKLAVERFRLVGVKGAKPYTPLNKQGEKIWQSRSGVFFDHRTKHLLAAMAGAAINSRIDRLFGIDFINEFLESAEHQELELLKQSCLYLDWKEDSLCSPQDASNRETAARWVALAGEIFAEILIEPNSWDAAIKRVQAFEISAGLPHE